MKNNAMDVDNIGIMQGFLDELGPEDDLEAGDYAEENRNTYDMERTPDSPEILMNNLRGDMRSVEARRDELADLVGYQAATETPEAVLAMLQPVLAQGAGLGALPQSAPMAQGPQPPMPPPPPGVGAPMGGALPPGGIAGPTGMPPAAMPAAPGPVFGGAPGMPPVGMAHGGYVQNFQAGSGEAGVTPDETDSTEGEEPLMLYPPALVNAARTEMQNLINKQPQNVPTLGSLMEKRVPEYQALLGGDKGRGMAEAQMLFDLGQRAFNFASNTDESGRPLRGGFFSRLAGAAKTLPSAMGKHIEALNNIDLKLKTLALQASEKDQDQVVAQNAKLMEQKRSIFGDILKAQAKVDAEKIKGLNSNIFKHANWDQMVINTPGLLDRYAIGKGTPEEDRLVMSAITNLRNKNNRIETRYDPVTRDPYSVEIRGRLIPEIMGAEARRKELGLPISATMSLTAATGAPAAAPAAATAPDSGKGVGDITEDVTKAGTPNVTVPGSSLWDDRFLIAGPVSAGIAAVSKIPGLGDPAAHVTLARKNAEIKAERLIDAMLKSTQGSVREQERLAKVYDIRPSNFTDPDAYGTGLIALGSALREGIIELDKEGGQQSQLAPKDKAEARRKAMDYRRFYSELKLPPVVYSVKDIQRYPVGTLVLVNGTTLKRIKAPE